MNERVKELAVQSGLKVESWMTNPPQPFQILGSAEEFEKFAQLIVKECANQCTYDGPFTAEVVWGKQFREKILKNFGIEE